MPSLSELGPPLNVASLRTFIKKKITSKVEFKSHIDERNELLNVIKRSITCGESDSVLVVGPRGCGKSYIINKCLLDVQKSFAEGDYLVVHLNGVVHTDDSLALRAIIQQLQVEALDGSQVSGSFADNLQFVLQTFSNGDRRKSTPIIFILDEFQHFCEHRNQTLLYNLFDLSKSAQVKLVKTMGEKLSMSMKPKPEKIEIKSLKAPICVVGETCRHDVTELLEKRVSSRFSHRILTLNPDHCLKERLQCLSDYLKVDRSSPLLRKVSQEYINEWNCKIDSLLALPNIVQRIRRQLEIDPSRRSFKNTMFVLVSKISEENPFITTELFEEAFRKYYVDSKVEYIKDLSVLELCLIISMCHHTEIYEGEPFNFEMVVEKYLKFARRNPSVQITQRPILLKAFERIKELEFILPLTASSRNQKKEYILYNLMVTKAQVQAAINSFKDLPTDVSQWAFSHVA